MSAEYSGKMDETTDPSAVAKTVFVLPRPLTSPQARIRALNLTGDSTGVMPTDDGQAWNGLSWKEGVRLTAASEQMQARFEADDAAWYD